MGKKFYTSISIFLLAGLVFSTIPSLAQTESTLPSPGLTPDNPFYFLERFFEGIGTFFTFGDVAKAKRYTKLAAERVAEAKAVVDKNKPEVAEKALKRYQECLEKSLAKAEEAQAKGKSVAEVTEIVSQATIKHLAVLEEVLEKVPEPAKSAVLQAREVSKTGHVKALEALSKEKPERAVKLNIQAIQNRLGKIKSEAANLVAEAMTNQIEDLDEIEDEVENFSPQMTERVKIIKTNAINGQIDILRSLAEVNPEKAAEIFGAAAEKRLNKAKQEVEDEDAEETEEAIKEFEKYAAFGQEISKIAQGIGKDTTTVEQLVARATTHHLEVLNDIYNKVPKPAKEAIQKAMTVSETGRQQAVEALKGKGALENIPETVPVPWEVKEKVFEGRGIPKPGIPKKEKTGKPEVETPKVEESETENPEIEEIEKPEAQEVEKPEVEIPEISPGPPAR